MSAEEKRQLGMALTNLSTEHLNRALEVATQSNPAFILNAEEVDLNIDAQVICCFSLIVEVQNLLPKMKQYFCCYQTVSNRHAVSFLQAYNVFMNIF